MRIFLRYFGEPTLVGAIKAFLLQALSTTVIVWIIRFVGGEYPRNLWLLALFLLAVIDLLAWRSYRRSNE